MRTVTRGHLSYLCAMGVVGLMIGLPRHAQAITAGGEVTSEPSLVAHWQLDDAVASPTATDSAGSFNGTVFSGVTFGQTGATSLTGSAAAFDQSTNARIDVPYSAALNTPNFTAEIFARVDGGAGAYRSPWTSRLSSPMKGYIFYAASNNNWEFWTGPGWDNLGGPAVVIGQWVQLAGTMNGTTKTFYMNGHPVSSRTVASYTPNDSALSRIGGGASESTPGSFHFNGNLDNAAYFDAALSHQRVSDHYNSYSPNAVEVLNAGPAAFWRLGEQSGTTAYNSVDVTMHSGTYLNGAAIRQVTGSALVSDPDTYAQFDGVNDYVAVPFSAALNPISFSVEALARVEGGQGGFRALVSSRDANAGTQGFIIYAGDNNAWQFWTGSGNAAWDKLEGSAVDLNEWVHVVATFDATSGPDVNGAYTGTKTLYLDGVAVASMANSLYEPNGSRELRIGAGVNEGTPNFLFNGDIDEVSIYNRALSPTEIAEHYNVITTGQLPLPPVPEPATLSLLGLAGFGMLARRRRAA